MERRYPMSLDHLFKAQFKTGQMIKIVTPHNAMLDACEVNIGTLTGKLRALPAILCDGVDESDPWHVVNLIDSNNMLLDHIAIKGAVSLGQAERLCQKYMPQMAKGCIRNIVTMTDNGMKTFIDSAVLPSKTPFVLEADAMLLDSMTTTTVVQWSEDNKLLSHGGHMSGVMYDMACCDTQGYLVEQVTARDIASLLIDDKCEFGGMFDAMVIKNRQFDFTIQKIAEALKTYDNDELFVKTVTLIEPFKRNGVVNIGAIFTMSDMQTITVLFNNPDTTPAKLTADDVLTSWKWMLNKRDVTATLQPRAVESKKYPMIAGRIIKLLARNHGRFKRAQMLREKDILILNELIDHVESAQSQIRSYDAQILQAQHDIDAETIRKQNETEIGKAELTAEGAEQFHKELKEALDKNEQNVQMNNDVQSKYSYKGGSITITKKEDVYNAILASGSVGGEFEGEIKAIQAWLAVRLQTIGEAVEGQSLSWDRTAEQLTLVSGEDVLGLQNEFVSYAEIEAVKTKFDLAKLIVKKLEKMKGWKHNGSTAVRDFVLDENNFIRYKFNVDLLAEGKEFRIDEVIMAGELDTSTKQAIVTYGYFTPTRENVKSAVETLYNIVEDHIAKLQEQIDQSSLDAEAMKQHWKNEQNEQNEQNVQMNNFEVAEGFSLAEVEPNKHWKLTRENVDWDVDINFSGEKYQSSHSGITSMPFDSMDKALMWGYTLLNERMNAKPEPQKGVVFKKEAESVYRSIDYSVLDYHGHTSDEFQRAKVKERLEPKIAEAEALLTRRFRDEFQRQQLEQSIKNAKSMIERWESKQVTPDPEPTITLDPEPAPKLSIVPDPVTETVPEVAMSEDEQFLNDVIAGTVDMSAEGFSDKLFAIAENLDPSLQELLDRVADAYANYAISLEV